MSTYVPSGYAIVYYRLHSAVKYTVNGYMEGEEQIYIHYIRYIHVRYYINIYVL